MYGFMLNVQKSSNLILNSIVHCDILFTSPLWKHWRLLLYMGGSQKRCTMGGDRVRDCITHLLSIKSLNVDDFHVS